MTDRSNDLDPADRIRQLQARRAASGRTQRPAVSARVAAVDADADIPADSAAVRPQMTTQRRRHPATATRWLLGGLSIASFFGIAGTVAVANVSSVATPTPVTATSSAPATNAVVSGVPAAATPVTSKATNVSAAASTAQVPHTTTRGS